MAWRASVGTVFRSLKFTFNEASSSAWGVAGFIESNHYHLKAHNPNLPVLVRSADDAKPIMEAATWDGRAVKADLSGLSPEDIESVLRGACNIKAAPADVVSRLQVIPIGPAKPIKHDPSIDGPAWHPGLKSLSSKFISDII